MYESRNKWSIGYFQLLFELALVYQTEPDVRTGWGNMEIKGRRVIVRMLDRSPQD